MSKFSEMYPDMAPSHEEGYKKNDPKKRHFSSYISPLTEPLKFHRSDEDERVRGRILPNPQYGHWCRPAPVHKISRGAFSWVCSSFLGKTTCPACSLSKKAYAAGDDTTGGKFRAKERFFVWMKDRKTGSEKDDPIILDLPQQSCESLVNLVPDEHGKKRPIDHLDQGHEISFTRRKNQGDFVMPSDFSIAENSSSVAGGQPDNVVKGWIDFVRENPLDDHFNILSDEKVRELLELPEDEDEDPEIQEVIDKGAPKEEEKPAKQAASTNDDAETKRLEMQAKIDAAKKAKEEAEAKEKPVQQEAVPSLADLQKQMEELGIK